MYARQLCNRGTLGNVIYSLLSYFNYKSYYNLPNSTTVSIGQCNIQHSFHTIVCFKMA